MNSWENYKFNKVKESIPHDFGFRVFYDNEEITHEIFGMTNKSTTYIAATTGTSLKVEYACQGWTAQIGEPSIIMCEISYDTTGHNRTKPHVNREYYTVVPTTRGVKLRIPLEDKHKEHFIKLGAEAEVDKIIKNLLPAGSEGTINEFYLNPESPVVDIKPNPEDLN